MPVSRTVIYDITCSQPGCMNFHSTHEIAVHNPTRDKAQEIFRKCGWYINGRQTMCPACCERRADKRGDEDGR